LEEWLARATSVLVLFVEASGALVVGIGSIQALYLSLSSLLRNATLDDKKSIWVRFAMWLLLGLEFELAADIIRSAIAPTWLAIGQVAAIAVIRTFLNFFLQRDIERESTPFK
jgi:uncharacterized membrane protein